MPAPAPAPTPAGGGVPPPGPGAVTFAVALADVPASASPDTAYFFAAELAGALAQAVAPYPVRVSMQRATSADALPAVISSFAVRKGGGDGGDGGRGGRVCV